MKNSHRTPSYFSAIEHRTPEIVNASVCVSVCVLVPWRCSAKTKENVDKSREKEAKMSFYSIERGWSMSYTVFPIIIAAAATVADVVSIVGCLAHTTEHCSLNFGTRKITFYQVEYNFATCFFFIFPFVSSYSYARDALAHISCAYSIVSTVFALDSSLLPWW